MTSIEQDYARCFSPPAGARVLSHLRQITTDRVIGINATDNQLRWYAAQSALFHHLESLIARGRGDAK